MYENLFYVRVGLHDGGIERYCVVDRERIVIGVRDRYNVNEPSFDTARTIHTRRGAPFFYARRPFLHRLHYIGCYWKKRERERESDRLLDIARPMSLTLQNHAYLA